MQVSTMSPIYQGHEDRGIQVLVDARLWFRRHVIGINVWPPDVSRIKIKEDKHGRDVVLERKRIRLHVGEFVILSWHRSRDECHWLSICNIRAHLELIANQLFNILPRIVPELILFISRSTATDCYT